MPLDRFQIGQFSQSSGLRKNVKPFLLPDDAFAVMNNAYVWRDTLRKRFGSRYIGNSQLSSRLRINIGKVTGNDVEANTFIPRDTSNNLITPLALGQMLSIGDNLFTVIDAEVGQSNNLLRSDGVASTATVHGTTGLVTIENVAVPNDTPVFFYPALPVMGLRIQEDAAINAENTIAFDTKFAYQYADGGWSRLTAEDDNNANHWNGTNYQFHHTCNWVGSSATASKMFITNNNHNEPNYMRILDGATLSNFRPAITDTDYLISASLLLPFKNRMLAFNVWTGPDINNAQQVRHRVLSSEVGNALGADSWKLDMQGKGFGVDAPTTQAIVLAGFLRDRLIVFFERSTYELVYTGNPAFPFVFQLLNSEMGAESRMSDVPFDKALLGVGNVGIMSCTGTNVSRIDAAIPDEVFMIHNDDNGIERVYGIRDYSMELAYWTFPSVDQSSDIYPFPTKVLVYNYLNNTWSINDDSITCFGYFQDENDVTWDSMEVSWDSDTSWDGFQLGAQFRQVLAGNQQGYTFLIDPQSTTNAAVLQITSLNATVDGIEITCINHNLRAGDYVRLHTIIGEDNLEDLNGLILKVVEIPQVGDEDNPNELILETVEDVEGDYLGGGTMSRVSRIDIRTKEYNFYAKDGKSALIPKVEFMVDSTAHGEITVDYYRSTSLGSGISQASNTGALLGTKILEMFPLELHPKEENATRLWHTVRYNGGGQVVQFRIYYSNEQMQKKIEVNDSFAYGVLEDFQINQIVFYARPSGRL